MTQLLARDRWRATRWTLLILLALSPVVLVWLSGMNWGLGDLVASTLLIFGAGVVYEAAQLLWRNPRHRLFAGAATLAGVMLVWAELAVGILD